jgi:hypothetical protein
VKAYNVLLKRVDNSNFDFDLLFKDGGVLVNDPKYFAPLRYDEVLGAATQKMRSTEDTRKLHLTLSALASPEVLPAITLPEKLAEVEHETDNKYLRFVIFNVTLKMNKQVVPFKSIAFFAMDGDVQFLDSIGVGAIVTKEYTRVRWMKSEAHVHSVRRSGGTLNLTYCVRRCLCRNISRSPLFLR